MKYEDMNNFHAYFPSVREEDNCGFYRDYPDKADVVNALDRVIEDLEFDVEKFAEIRYESYSLTVRVCNLLNQGRFSEITEDDKKRSRYLTGKMAEMMTPVYERLIEEGFDKKKLIT